MSIVRRVLLLILSCGWLLPLCLAYNALLSFIAYQAIPEVQGKVLPISFPYREFSRNMADVAAIWLAVAIGYWVIAFARQAGGGRPTSPPAA